MAHSNKALRDLVECAVCLDIFTNPHQLHCLHSFCYDCLMKLVNDKTIVCPTCRKDSPLQSIKKDFKSQEIVDTYNRHVREQKQSEFLQTLFRGRERRFACQVCENASEISRWHCVECDQLMCQQCEKVHKSIKSCRNHTVVLSAEFVAILKGKINSDRRELVKLRQEQVGTVNTSQNENLAKITAWQTNSTAVLEELEKHHHMCITEHYGQLKESVNNLSGEFLKNLQGGYHFVQKYEHELEALEKKLTSGLETATVDGLLEMAEMGIQDAYGIISKLSKAVIECKVTELPVSVINGEELELHKASYLMSQNCAFKSIVDNSVSRITRHKSTYKVTGSLKLDCLPQRLLMVSEKLICIGTNNTISAFDLNCQFCGKVQEPDLRELRSLTEVHNGCLIAACDNSVGLHLLSHEAKYIGAIATGSFSDVTSWSLYLYALEYEQCKVLTFEETAHHNWKQINEMKLNYSSRHSNSWDTVRVNKDGIFVCALKTCSIYQHDHNGQLLQQFGEKGSGDLGKLRHPRLGFVDSESCALILDTQNNKIKVYNSRTSSWSALDIEGEVVVPLDAIVSQTAEHLWIIQDSYGTPILSSYVLKRKV